MSQDPPSSPRCPVLVLALPGASLLDISGLIDTFATANGLLDQLDLPPFYDIELASTREELTTDAGLRARAILLEDAAPPHSLVIGGAEAWTAQLIPRAILEQVQRLAGGAARLIALGAGTFALGHLGVLDGRRCTTHWALLDALAERCPKALIERDALHVIDEPLYTAAGAATSIDLALAILARDLGPELALTAARRLITVLNRPGGQSQFNTAPRIRSELDHELRALLEEVAANPAADHRVDRLAERMSMSPRHFARVFHKKTGQTPAAAIRELRLEAARQALEASDHSTKDIARACGFGSESTLRRSFEQSLGVSPAEYRRRFRLS